MPQNTQQVIVCFVFAWRRNERKHQIGVLETNTFAQSPFAVSVWAGIALLLFAHKYTHKRTATHVCRWWRWIGVGLLFFYFSVLHRHHVLNDNTVTLKMNIPSSLFVSLSFFFISLCFGALASTSCCHWCLFVCEYEIRNTNVCVSASVSVCVWVWVSCSHSNVVQNEMCFSWNVESKTTYRLVHFVSRKFFFYIFSTSMRYLH